MSDDNRTVEEAEILPGVKVPFTFYEGPSSHVPVLDIGDLLGAVLGAQKTQVIGDTDDSFTVFLSKGNKHTLAITFTAMSFGDPPAEGPPMHRAQYNRYHMVVMDFTDLKQVNVPFTVPAELAYQHEKGIWGLKLPETPAWSAPKEEIYEVVGQFVEPLITWVDLAHPQY